MKDIYLGPVKLKPDQLSDPVNCSVAILTSDPGALEAQLADVFSGPAQMSSSGPFVSADTVLDSRLDIPRTWPNHYCDSRQSIRLRWSGMIQAKSCPASLRIR